MTQSDLEATFAYYWRVLNGPPLVAEYRFHPQRRHRLDFAWPDKKIGIEIQGGTWLQAGGRHNRGEGYTKDCIKLNLAVLAGWRLFWLTGDMLTNEPELHLKPIIALIESEL